MDRRNDMAVEALMEQLIEHGPGDIATAFGRAFELAMQIERERFLGAGLYERTDNRRGYANGYKPRRIDTPAGTVAVDVPKTAGHDGAPFYPQSLERGRRSVRAVMLAVAEMYVKGVSTREAERVMREFGIDSLSSTQVSRAAKLLDEELEAWRTRALGQITYLLLDARYEKVRQGGIVRDAAVLSAIGVGPELRFLGAESSPAFVRAPEGNGCAERFIRTLKENLLWVRWFETIEDLRQALLEFQKTYNEHWLIERHGHRPPAAIRREQTVTNREAA